MQDDDQPDFSNGMIQQDPSAPARPPFDPEPEDTPSGPESIEIRYDGRWEEIAGLAATNALLSFVTLGIYSFWGRTRIRKYLWSHTRVNGSPLEYHGTGGQIFVGFIVITLVFFLINVISQLLQSALIDAALNSGMTPAAIAAFTVLAIGFAVIYFTFFAYITYSVRRYWLAMTSWRGIRLRQGGRRLTLLRLAFPRAALATLTLGLTYPWLVMKTEGYAVGQSHVGDRQFRFDAPVGPLFRGWLPFWIAYVLLLGIVPAAIALLVYSAHDPGTPLLQQIGSLPFDPASILSFTGIYFAATLLLAAFAYAHFRARLFNVNVSAISLGDLSFVGAISWRRFFSAYLRAIALTIGVLIGPVLVISILAGPLAPFILVLLMWITFGFVRNVIIVHGLWKARVEATTVIGSIDVGEIHQAQIERMRQGEGFGMVFDAGFGEA